jgi:hypothetical protein
MHGITMYMIETDMSESIEFNLQWLEWIW